MPNAKTIMKKRILYSLLFAVPGFFFSLIIAFALTGFAAGFFWIFVFGDNPWPESIGTVLPLLMILFFLVPWFLFIWVGCTTGKKLETEAGVNKKHILASVGFTVAPILFIALYQLKVGNIGSKADSQLCDNFCQQKGYSGSAMVPTESSDKSCVCFDDSGREVLNVPVEPELGGNNFRQDRLEESDAAYYCRVIFPNIRPINLSYKDDILSFTPTLLGHDGRSNALFIVHGSYRAVNEFAKDAVLKINGESPYGRFSLMPVETSCGLDAHFIGVDIPGLITWPETGVELLVPSTKAMFDLHVRYHPISQ